MWRNIMREILPYSARICLLYTIQILLWRKKFLMCFSLAFFTVIPEYSYIHLFSYNVYGEGGVFSDLQNKETKAQEG